MLQELIQAEEMVIILSVISWKKGKEWNFTVLEYLLGGVPISVQDKSHGKEPLDKEILEMEL